MFPRERVMQSLEKYKMNEDTETLRSKLMALLDDSAQARFRESAVYRDDVRGCLRALLTKAAHSMARAQSCVRCT